MLLVLGCVLLVRGHCKCLKGESALLFVFVTPDLPQQTIGISVREAGADRFAPAVASPVGHIAEVVGFGDQLRQLDDDPVVQAALAGVGVADAQEWAARVSGNDRARSGPQLACWKLDLLREAGLIVPILIPLLRRHAPNVATPCASLGSAPRYRALGAWVYKRS